MKECVAVRVGRILRRRLSELVRVIEDGARETLTVQVLREVEAAIEEWRSELGRTIAAEHQAKSQLSDEDRRHAELAVQTEAAIGVGRDDVAAAAIAEQIAIEARIPVLKRRIGESRAAIEELEYYVRALLLRKQEILDKLQSVSGARASVQPAGSGLGEPGPAAGIDGGMAKAEEALEALLGSPTGGDRKGASAAVRDSDLELAAKLAELDDLARAKKVQERLATLKEKAAKKA